ncbi:hypothetical protein PMAYCL1PPCAC_27582, partial [Pristionchus mayeri]
GGSGSVGDRESLAYENVGGGLGGGELVLLRAGIRGSSGAGAVWNPEVGRSGVEDDLECLSGCSDGDVSDVLGVIVIVNLLGESGGERGSGSPADILGSQVLFPLALASEDLAERVPLVQMHLVHLGVRDGQHGQKDGDG